MRKHAMSVLMEASSINGLFPGWLRKGNIPVSYEGEKLRDSYWEAVFEIPYILWEYCGKGSRKAHSDHDKDNIVATERETQAILQEVKSILDASVEICNLLKDGQSPTSKTPKARRELAMKAVQPFNNIVNEENIVELQDEWLYNEPSFFVDEANTMKMRTDRLSCKDGAVTVRLERPEKQVFEVRSNG
ncbi:hypothetical protein K456DRAFT_1720121 [Colletotrichum gloeosporioides 23]|nr:hypothetical protein K456DRAFT_1720121 [Colletotrichum gloeosporioides 23]